MLGFILFIAVIVGIAWIICMGWAFLQQAAGAIISDVLDAAIPPSTTPKPAPVLAHNPKRDPTIAEQREALRIQAEHGNEAMVDWAISKGLLYENHRDR